MLRILNKKQADEIYALLKKQWGISHKFDCVLLKHDDGRVYLATKEAASLDVSKLRVNSLGLYIGEIANNEIRLSIEGAQLLGQYAKKNVVEVNKKQLKEWLAGEDVEIEVDAEGFVILKHSQDYVGSGKYKNGKVLNFVPKARRLQTIV